MQSPTRIVVRFARTTTAKAVVGLLVGVSAALVIRRVWFPAGQIVFDQPTFEAPPMNTPDARTVSHRFAFRNVGGGPVRISKVETSCGCTTAFSEHDVYLPGESGYIDAALSLPSFGKKAVDIFVYSENSTDPIHLQIAGAFMPAVHASWIPAQPELVGPASSADCLLTLEALSTHPGETQVLSTGAKRGLVRTVLVKSELHPMPSMLGYFRTTFTFRVTPAQGTEGEISDSIAIRLSQPFESEIVIPVSGHIGSGFVLRPSKLLYISADRQITPTICRVAVTNLQQFSIDRINNPFKDWLTVSVDSTEPDGAVLTAKVSRQPPSSVLSGSIEIVMRDSSGVTRNLSIPVSVRVEG